MLQSKIDLKSVLLGVAVGGLLMAVVGAAPNPAGEAGRFTIETGEGHAFVLDTTTGQVWAHHFASASAVRQPGFHDVKLPRPGAR